MTDKELLALCKKLKLPKVMWDTAELREHLLALINAAKEIK